MIIFLKKVCRLIFLLYLCTRNTTTGCSAVRLAHLVWDQRVPGSNPGIPTERDKRLSLFFCFRVFDSVTQKRCRNFDIFFALSHRTATEGGGLFSTNYQSYNLSSFVLRESLPTASSSDFGRDRPSYRTACPHR